MWAHPGKKLLFMGGELAQERSGSEGGRSTGTLLDYPIHAGVQALRRATSTGVYRAEPALWEVDFRPEGFRWLESATRARTNVIAFARFSADGARPLVCVVQLLAGRPRTAGASPLPVGGYWREVLNTDAAATAARASATSAAIEARARAAGTASRARRS